MNAALRDKRRTSKFPRSSFGWAGLWEANCSRPELAAEHLHPNRRAAFTARRAWRTQLVLRQFAVAVFIERFQRRGRIGNFVGVNHAVMIRIERVHQRRG